MERRLCGVLLLCATKRSKLRRKQMNYEERYNNYSNWENQCNFPDDWNCDYNYGNNEHANKTDKKYFYGYFVGTEINTNHNNAGRDNNCNCKKEDRCNDNRKCEDRKENIRPCQNNNRRCNCCICNLFRCF